jgi:acetyl-CoA C-acetyltransferase
MRSARPVKRSGVELSEIEDVIFGTAVPQGTQQSIGRNASLRAGLPVTVSGLTIERQCSSGLLAIATAAKQVIVDRMNVVLAGGVESISLVQTPALRIDEDPELAAMVPDIYMSMLHTAGVVAKRYGVSRDRQDACTARIVSAYRTIC